jgi:hypothetical protein
MIESLGSTGKWKLNKNLSRSVSFSILDENNDELSIETTVDHSIELIIPRDRNLLLPPMSLQDVTSINNSSENQLFDLNYINIKSLLSISVHFQIRPWNTELDYLFISKFDYLNSIDQIDGWSILCPWKLTEENLYTYFIDNQHTIVRQAVIYGLRELNSEEM